MDHSNNWLVGVLAALTVITDFNISGQESSQEYCEDESFSASCPEGSAILVSSAVYGRMHPGRCVTNDHIGCQGDVRHHLDRWCSGQNKCQVPVSNLIQDGTRTCAKDYRSFLEADYTCVKVLQGRSDGCDSQQILETTSTSGFISSYITTQTGCGSIDTPWRIKAGPGQRINVTLFDFSTVNFASTGFRHVESSQVCTVYAIIRETLGTQARTVCGGKSRETNIFMSVTNSIDIRIIGKKKSGGEDDFLKFMLHYKVLGCPDPKLPAGAWMKRDDKGAAIGCESSSPIWHLRCNGSNWIEAEIGVCDEGEMKKTHHKDGDKDMTPYFRGLSLIIIAIVAGMVGLFILLAGLFFFRRRRRLSFVDRYGGPSKDCSQVGRHSPDGGSRRFQQSKNGSADLMYCSGDNGYLSNKWQTTAGDVKEIPVSSFRIATNCSVGGIRYSEHLYESPKFERKSFMTYSETGSDVGVGEAVDPCSTGRMIRSFTESGSV